ncbi:unnamed protein product [Knipowitschia caucasica]|uniref:POU domain class 2-associating factor 1 n=1 Tax=Knipowitschia caucasica TaxID=637954 RepID=A0AAV2J3P4_KNICA
MPTTSCAVQPSFLLRSAPESSPPHTLGPNQSYTVTTALSTSTELYMQTLCPSYTMLTYTHTPLLTNFGTVAPVPTHLPQMDSDCSLTYLPWTAMSSPAALSGSPLLHVPLSVPFATMIPQLDLRGPSAESSIQEQPMLSGTESPSEREVPEIKQESPSLLDALLEEQKSDNEQHKDMYSNPIYVTHV